MGVPSELPADPPKSESLVDDKEACRRKSLVAQTYGHDFENIYIPEPEKVQLEQYVQLYGKSVSDILQPDYGAELSSPSKALVSRLGKSFLMQEAEQFTNLDSLKRREKETFQRISMPLRNRGAQVVARYFECQDSRPRFIQV